MEVNLVRYASATVGTSGAKIASRNRFHPTWFLKFSSINTYRHPQSKQQSPAPQLQELPEYQRRSFSSQIFRQRFETSSTNTHFQQGSASLDHTPAYSTSRLISPATCIFCRASCRSAEGFGLKQLPSSTPPNKFKIHTQISPGGIIRLSSPSGVRPSQPLNLRFHH